jgi:hypothetical protein
MSTDNLAANISKEKAHYIINVLEYLICLTNYVIHYISSQSIFFNIRAEEARELYMYGQQETQVPKPMVMQQKDTPVYTRFL